LGPPRRGIDAVSLDLVLGGGLTVLILAQLALILWNRRELTGGAGHHLPDDAPRVSVLVPARNEEEAIGRCLEHLVAQDYPDLEIIVLDDDSSDATRSLAEAFPEVQVVAGAPLPRGWTGKNWACHQLAGLASGDVLCFVDADTTLEPGAVSAAVAVMSERGAALVSLLPRAEYTSVSGAVLLPMVTHALFGLFPVALVHRSRRPSISVAFGPFILVTAAGYRAAGGHAADPSSVVDDVQLSRNVKAAGGRVRLADGTDLVATRWYDRLGDIWRGFAKNAYGGIGYNPWLGAAIVFVLMPLLLAPFARVGIGAVGGGIPEAALWQALLLVANRALTSHFGRDPYWSSVLYPVMVAFWGITLVRSMVWYATQRSVVWKDRDVPTYPM
jgi:chlorobactene glucosyltransferase